ncbi:caskin-1 [Plakobranchus ocellatus]|uniref:Caskin-1 n=1 Tax=Plakobranchus ocellatus TaxID=259542 RepID=A0AAV3ZVF8_9GAST|nr:caskin-1 [Plakobranchus ocellatus]
MSRGVRDLRDLICVSRLTFHESEDDDAFAESRPQLRKELSSVSLSSLSTDSKTPRNPLSARVTSPDSGFATNGSPSASGLSLVNSSDSTKDEGDGVFITSTSVPDSPVQQVPTTAHATFVKSTKKKKRKKSGLSVEPTRHELPGPSPLPPVETIAGTGILREEELAEAKPSYERVQSARNGKSKTRVNFDDMLTYMDATIVAGWLTRANDAIQEVTAFCAKGDNFVQFAHFWLSSFPDLQKKDIFSMEYDFLIEELKLAFAVGRENRAVVRGDLTQLCSAVFKEYPTKVLGAKGPHIFLDYLDILSSDKHVEYKKLLSDVRCATTNRQYAQWLLAVRSFALVSVWFSVINFYRNLVGSGAKQGMPILGLCSSQESVPNRRMLQAIRLGYIDVIHYLLLNGHVSSTFSDSHRKTWVFMAVMHNQPAVLKYLLTKVHPSIDVNQAADTGNTALHAAANSGKLPLVEMLCECESIDVNCVNLQCENATPLHLSIMHGHEEIVACLLKHGADSSLKMGETSVTALARDFNHTEILEMLNKS